MDGQFAENVKHTDLHDLITVEFVADVFVKWTITVPGEFANSFTLPLYMTPIGFLF